MLSALKRKLFDPKKALLKVLGDVELPTFPAVVMRALDELRSEDVSLRQVGKTIAADPGLSVKILRVANSALYSLRHPARSVPHAVELLGRGEVESLLLSVAVGDALPTDEAGLAPGEFWGAAARRAGIARELARELHSTTQSESFTAALLEDMAVPLLAAHRGDEYRPVLATWREAGGNLAALERERFEWDHAEVAMLLCKQWSFPESLTAAIAGHHADPRGEAAPPPAVSLVSELGLVDNPQALQRLCDRASDEFGLRPERCSELVAAGLEAADSIAAQFAA